METYTRRCSLYATASGPLTVEEVYPSFVPHPDDPPPRALRFLPLGSIDLPNEIAVWQPEYHDGNYRTVLAAVAGPYEIVALGSNAVVVRRPNAVVVDWREIPLDLEANVAVGAAGAALESVAYPGPNDARDAPLVYISRSPQGSSFVWIEDPQDLNEMRAYSGLDAGGAFAALVVEFALPMTERGD